MQLAVSPEPGFTKFSTVRRDILENYSLAAKAQVIAPAELYKHNMQVFTQSSHICGGLFLFFAEKLLAICADKGYNGIMW